MGCLMTRDYRPGDEVYILSLFEKAFGKHLDERVWYWRYMENPYGQGIIKLMFQGGELIGHYAASPLPLWFRNRYMKAALLVSAMTHPEYRGKGVCTKLATHVYETCRERGCKLVFGFPNENVYRLYIEHLEWIGFGMLPCWEAKPASLIKKIKGFGFHVESAEEFDEGFDKLWIKVRNRLSIAVPRVSRYLSWRYRSNPGSKYHIYVAKDSSGAIQGFVVLKIYEEADEASGHIIDILSTDSPQVKSMLINSALEFFSTFNIRRITCWVPEDAGISALLRDAGFKRRVWKTYFGTRLLNIGREDARFASDFNNWYITMGDSDVF